MTEGCGSPVGGAPLREEHIGRETVVQGILSRGGRRIDGAYVRLLDRGGDFAAEVVTDAGGGFRFFAAPGEWTLRALAAGGQGERTVSLQPGQLTEVTLELTA